MTVISTTSLLSQAQALADELVAVGEAAFVPTDPPPDSFMVHRPNCLAESYRHGQGVAEILERWGADLTLQAAGLLHSLVYKEVLSVERVAEICGEQVAFLCREYWHVLQQVQQAQPRGNLHTLKRVKLYIAAYRDPDLAFLGMANLWDHFLLARQSKPSLQRSFTYEVRAILIPLLSMLGMWELKEEAEEWVMQHGPNQQDYQYLIKRLAQTETPRRQAFELVSRKLQPVLPQAHLTRKIRTPVQIYNPQFPEKTHPEALQKLTVNVLVDTEEACYAALRWIHRFWKPVQGSLMDCVGTNELNGYRCLQTAVVVPMESGHMRVNFHIRTHEMDEINQWGLAALELRKCCQAELPHAWWSQREETYAKINSAPLGSLPETLYVFSPQGQVFQFHRGCTVVDYAYKVHSEVAHQCKRFTVNGEVVGPTTVLRHLDLVELERDPQFPGPTQAWLNAARTSRARHHIERFLNRRAKGSQYGQTVLDRHLQALEEHYRIDIPDYRVKQTLNKAVRRFKLESSEDLLAEIAAGRLASDVILHPLFSDEIIRQVQLPVEMQLSPRQVSLAQCCKPCPGDNIVGRPRFREGKVARLKIHQAGCQDIVDHQNTISLSWRLQPKLNTVVRLEVTALHELHLLEEALQVFYKRLPDVVLHKLDFVTRGGIARLDFTIEAKDQGLIAQIAQDIEQLPGRTINEVRQMQLLFSEREELAQLMTPTTFNPYRRLPVREREMLFGRSEELARVYDLLQAETGTIFVRGQKRVGKTSLLLHLEKHYLARTFAVPVFIDFQILGHLTSQTFFYEIANTVYTQLQADYHLSDVGPPLREFFETAPPTGLISYLKSVQSHFGSTKLVLLIDEFSRTIDAYQQHQLGDDFFQQWRGILHATTPHVSYVMVVQQQAHDALLEHTKQRTLDPIWHLLEMGETLLLRPLSEKDARQLIERPTYNYLEYSPEALHYVWRLTGGSPFLIQAFCFNLVRYMARGNRRRVEWEDVEKVQLEFMNPNESLFAHLLDMLRGVGQPICRQLTQFIDETDEPVPLTELKSALPDIPAEQFLDAVQELLDRHILIQPRPDACQFASLLFGRWLVRHTALEQMMSSN